MGHRGEYTPLEIFAARGVQASEEAGMRREGGMGGGAESGRGGNESEMKEGRACRGFI